jgi:2,3-bisphosphoglycerate-independent phosphoglycerate mutase
MAETREEKIERLLKEKKVKFESEKEYRVFFTVRGDHDTYSVIYDKPKKRWLCMCDASPFVGQKYSVCTHAEACERYFRSMQDKDEVNKIGESNTAFPDL